MRIIVEPNAFDEIYQVALERACKKHIVVKDVADGHIVGRLIW